MKRLILVSAMILGLAATGAMASQNKNSKPAPKAAASSETGGAMKSTGGGKHHRRHHHRKSKGTSTGTMSATPKAPKNSK